MIDALYRLDFWQAGPSGAQLRHLAGLPERRFAWSGLQILIHMQKLITSQQRPQKCSQRAMIYVVQTDT